MSLDLTLPERYAKAKEKLKEYALEIHEAGAEIRDLEARVTELEAGTDPRYKTALEQIAAGRGKYAKVARDALEACTSDTEPLHDSAAS